MLFLSTFHLGCTCFLLFVCYCTTICGTPGDVATHNLAAKNLRWVIYCLVNIYFFMFKISHVPPTSGYISFSPPIFLNYYRWSLLVGLSWRRPALHPWNELGLYNGWSTNSSYGDRNRSPSISSSALSGPGRPADCFQPLAFPGPLLLLHLVDCCLPFLHLPVWPLLPSVSHGGIASPGHWCHQPPPSSCTHTHNRSATNVYSLIKKDWVGGGQMEAYLQLNIRPPFPSFFSLTTSTITSVISSELLVQLPVLPP